MIGRRRPDFDPFEVHDMFDPGDYGFAVYPDGRRVLHIRCPTGDPPVYGNCAAHDVVEHEDGTVTVSPSILVRDGDRELWHGYLERGVWRSV